MPRIQPLDPSSATGQAKELLDAVQKKLGRTPNIMKTMAHAPAVLQMYLSSSQALSHGALDGKLRERLALAVGEQNQCGYCVAAHTAIGKMQGLSEEETLANRRGESSDPRAAAAVKFARQMVEKRGHVADAEVKALRDAGFNDGEIAEITANVVHNIFTNYFNHVTDPEIDFPAAPALK